MKQDEAIVSNREADNNSSEEINAQQSFEKSSPAKFIIQVDIIFPCATQTNDIEFWRSYELCFHSH